MTYEQKLARIEELMVSPDVIKLDLLTAEVEAFEKENFVIETPSIADAMKFRRDQMLITQKEASVMAGMSLSRWQNLENGKHDISIADARKLYAIGIPASVLLQPKSDK